MKKIYWYNDLIGIERNGKKHIYAIRQVSNESIRRLWRIRDKSTLVAADFYKSVHRY